MVTCLRQEVKDLNRDPVCADRSSISLSRGSKHRQHRYPTLTTFICNLPNPNCYFFLPPPAFDFFPLAPLVVATGVSCYHTRSKLSSMLQANKINSAHKPNIIPESLQADFNSSTRYTHPIWYKPYIAKSSLQEK
ncbi:unnamed protein product [Linum trigynum]|uniref:Uncharacterized protein n=1 Tax=Linum trigynum TaxID=586398 RepID=A0AAV2GAZ5_9ROSI